MRIVKMYWWRLEKLLAFPLFFFFAPAIRLMLFSLMTQTPQSDISAP